MISNRLKTILLGVVSKCQSAFIPGRLITDNTLVTYKLFRYIHGLGGSGGAMALKLDMSKAFDRVEWLFLEKIMLKLDFPGIIIDLVMKCIPSSLISHAVGSKSLLGLHICLKALIILTYYSRMVPFFSVKPLGSKLELSNTSLTYMKDPRARK